MAKKRERNQNPEPFLPSNDYKDTNSVATSSKKRSKASKQHQKHEKTIAAGLSSKILKEALIQQKEIEDEEEAERNPNSVVNAFASVDDGLVKNRGETEEEIDAFDGFSDAETQFGDYEKEINEEDEKLLEAFLSKDAGPQCTLADIIVEKIKQKDAEQSSGDVLDAKAQPLSKMDPAIIDTYKKVGQFLSKYTTGKLPTVFKRIAALEAWEEILYMTEPENWSPNAVFQATRIFASNFGSRKAQRFYNLVLLSRIREDIRKNKRLHFALYQSLKKALYKPAAFNKGILLPLCESGTCTLREAVIIGSIIQKVSIPMLHSSVALLKLAQMKYCGTTSYFILVLLEKKYALPYRVVDAVVAHFMRFLDDERIMPVIWHQSLLMFVQRYKNELLKEDKDSLRKLIAKQKHKLVTPEIMRELDNSRSRGEKEDDMVSISSPVFIVNKMIEEDKFDIPQVPMEED